MLTYVEYRQEGTSWNFVSGEKINLSFYPKISVATNRTRFFSRSRKPKVAIGEYLTSTMAHAAAEIDSLLGVWGTHVH